MIKKYTYLAMAMMVALSCIPPIDFVVKNPNTDKWFIMILIAGFFGFFTLFIKTNPIIRVVAIGTFIDCFFSSCPYVSFTAYVSTVVCCYFYILCTRIEDWSVIFKAFQALLFLNILLIFMQAIGHDSLLNFGLGKDIACYGVIGQHMQMASFAVVLCAFLIMYNKMNFVFPFLIAIFCNSSWTLLAAGMGLFVWLGSFNKRLATYFMVGCIACFALFATVTHKIDANTTADSGRFHVWSKAIHLANQRPIFGWGPGMFKEIFHSLSGMTCIPYKTAHNFIVQLLFEVGYPFTIFILVSIGILFYRIFKGWHIVMDRKDRVLMTAGFSMIFVDMMVHFPEKMMQCVMIIICFLAYCESKKSLK